MNITHYSFERIRATGTKKKSTHVAEQIIDAISKGEYKVGYRLPPERKIAEEMGVSRVPVREALSALQIVGIVESIIGEGTYIRRSAENTLVKSQALSLVEEHESPFEAYRARKIFEAAIIDTAIDQADHEDISKIEGALKRMDEAVNKRDFDGYFKANRDFHMAIAQATNNSPIKNIIDYLLSILGQQLWKEAAQKHFTNYEHIKEYLHKHRRILDAIKGKDKNRARTEIESHFNETVEEVKKYL